MIQSGSCPDARLGRYPQGVRGAAARADLAGVTVSAQSWDLRMPGATAWNEGVMALAEEPQWCLARLLSWVSGPGWAEKS
jgi:hypothetical protein